MSRSRHGFSLVEVLVSVAILAILISGISFVLIKQSQASAMQIGQRDMEENGRLALLELSRAVRQAGYGITPAAAFDFDRFACTTPGTPSTCPNGGRDRTDGPDELVVAWRDGMFVRTVTAKGGAGPYTVNINAALKEPLKQGRIVQLLCTGAEPSAYVALNADAAAGDTTLQLRTLTAADGYFPTAAPADGCFASASVFLIERIRYYVANDPQGIPSLYRDRGRGTQEMQYQGIDDLQISYDIGRPPAGSNFAVGGATPAPAPGCTPPSSGVTSWSFGSCAGVAGAPPESATAPDWRNDAYDSVNRYTGHPMNIRNVNIFLVARSKRPFPAQVDRVTNQFGDAMPAILNRPARAADTFARTVLSVSEQPQNLLSRAHFLPPVFANGNVGGG